MWIVLQIFYDIPIQNFDAREGAQVQWWHQPAAHGRSLVASARSGKSDIASDKW